MPTVQANGLEIYYEQHGSGDDLVLIMGMVFHSGSWARQVEALAPHFRVTIFDNRGAGRSGAPDEPYSIAQMVEDTRGLLDALGISRAHLAGISMGGMIAQELAIRYPSYVDRMVVMASRARAAHSRQLLAGAQTALRHAAMPPMLRAVLTMPWGWSSGLLQEHDRFRALLASANANAYPIKPHAYLRQLDAMLSHDARGRLHSITSPTLVMVGAEDILTPVAESIELARLIPRAHLRVLPRGGHGMHLEYAEDVNRELLAFLRGEGQYVTPE